MNSRQDSVVRSAVAFRAKAMHVLDVLKMVVRLPQTVVIGILKILYLVFCMILWGLMLWVLGDKHLGVLKILIFLASAALWVVFIAAVISLVSFVAG